MGSEDGYFTPEQRQALFARIHASGAKIVTVAMGSPKQELLMRDCREVHPHALYMGVGGTYDVFTGHVKRAQKYGRTWDWSGCIVCFLNRGVLPARCACCAIFAGTILAISNSPF